MVSMNLADAQTRLSALVAAALKGEEVVIANAGEPLVRVVPCQPRVAPRQPGRLRGQIRIADDFDSPDDAIVKLFEEGRRADCCSTRTSCSGGSPKTPSPRSGCDSI